MHSPKNPPRDTKIFALLGLLLGIVLTNCLRPVIFTEKELQHLETVRYQEWRSLLLFQFVYVSSAVYTLTKIPVMLVLLVTDLLANLFTSFAKWKDEIKNEGRLFLPILKVAFFCMVMIHCCGGWEENVIRSIMLLQHSSEEDAWKSRMDLYVNKMFSKGWWSCLVRVYHIPLSATLMSSVFAWMLIWFEEWIMPSIFWLEMEISKILRRFFYKPTPSPTTNVHQFKQKVIEIEKMARAQQQQQEEYIKNGNVEKTTGEIMITG